MRWAETRIDTSHSWIEAAGLRRIVFATEAEWEAGCERLDALLAFPFPAQHELLDRLPESCERAVAQQKLEEAVTADASRSA